MSAVLVVGATGFIGRAVRTVLRADGHDVLCVSRSAHPSAANEHWQVADILAEPDALAALVRRRAVHAVINCAGALTGDVPTLVRANVLLPAMIIDAVSGTRVRLIHAGSSAEYGPGEEGASVDEAAPANPTGPYGITKLAGTLLVAAAIEAGRIEGVVLRVFNPVGPGMTADTLPGRVAQSIQRAVSDRQTSIDLGPLEAWRDFVDVRDAAAALVAAALTEAPADPVLNVGTGQAVQARTLVELMLSASGWAGRVTEGGQGSSRSAAVGWQQASIERISSQLGWRPRRSLAEAAESVFASGA